MMVWLDGARRETRTLFGPQAGMPAGVVVCPDLFTLEFIYQVSIYLIPGSGASMQRRVVRPGTGAPPIGSRYTGSSFDRKPLTMYYQKRLIR